MVVVALAHLVPDPDPTPLPAHERAEAGRRLGRAGAEYTCGRLLVRRLVRQVLGIEADITLERSGRPALTGGWISLSHSDGLVAAAVSDRPIGVDVEGHGSEPVVREMARRWLAPGEAADLRRWTAKEAVLKALGTGLRTPPRSFRIHPDGWAELPERPRVAPLDAGPGHAGAVAWIGGEAAISVRWERL